MKSSPSLLQRLAQAFRPSTPSPHSSGTGGWIVPSTNWKALLSSEEMNTMALICPPRQYAKGEIFFKIGDPGDRLFILLEGHVKITLPSPQGERVVAICGPDDFFGESFLTYDQERTSNAVSLSSRVIACPVSRDQFLRVAQQVPTVVLTFATALVERTRTLESELQRTNMPAEVRLAMGLILLARRFGTELAPGMMELNLEIKHEELGSLAGTTRVSATTAMSAWREQGLIEGTRGIYRINVQGLEALVERLEWQKGG